MRKGEVGDSDGYSDGHSDGYSDRMLMKSCVFLCRDDGSFKHVSRSQWLQLVAGQSSPLASPARQLFLQVEYSIQSPSPNSNKPRHGAVYFTRWEAPARSVVPARCADTLCVRAAWRETLAALMQPESGVAATCVAAAPLQSSLQDYIGNLLDVGAQRSRRLNRVA